MVLYDVIDIISNVRRAREQRGVIAISDDDFSCVVASQSIHCSVFFFLASCFHPPCLFRKAASQCKICVCFYSRACLKLVMLLEANIIAYMEKKKNYFVGLLLCQELCRDRSVLPML